MVTYKTLEEYREKCIDALGMVKAEYQKRLDKQKALEADIRVSEEQIIAIEAQLLTINQLMDIENNPPAVELPFGFDDLEEQFEKRLEGPEGLSPEEVHRDRQEMTYLKEALQAVEDIDAINSEELASWEDPEVDS